MESTPIGCDLFWEEDPAPVPRPTRPTTGSDLDWWRETSRLLVEDHIEQARRLRRPVKETA